ncbi:MAG TPA: hypothetical protein ENK57_09695 [Polyangiaceae bacterium]|nr:hypothetical protein [Polyangiaceae bacterium]
MTRRGVHELAALGIAAALAWSSPTWARDEPSEVDKDAARTLVQQGDELMKNEELEEALVAYRRADDIMGVPTTSIEVGRVNLLLGKLVDARAAFEKAASYPKKDGEPKPFTKARKEARRQLELVSPKIPRLTIMVEGVKGGTATATLDDDPVALDEEILVDPGPHVVRAEADGYVPASEDFILEEFDLKDVTLRLEEAPRALWPLAYVGYGIAGTGALVGAITGALSLRDAQTVKDACDGSGDTCPSGIPLDRSRTLAHVSTASFVVAGVAATVGTIGLVLSLSADDSSPESSDPGVEASLSVGPAYVDVTVDF